MTSYIWKGTPDEESRQQYATERIQQVQRCFPRKSSFTELLEMFCFFGELYDRGYRLSDVESAA